MRALYLLLPLFIVSCGTTQTFKTIDINNTQNQLKPESGGLFLVDVVELENINLHIAPNAINSEAHSMMYYADGYQTLLASIIAHATIEKTLQESRKSNEYTKSNRALAKYHKNIKKISNEFILNKAIHDNNSEFNLTTDILKTDVNFWKIEIIPDFVISNNKNDISIIAKIGLNNSDNSKELIHSKVVFVQSDQAIHSIGKLFTNNSSYLKNILSSLMFSAIDLFIKDSIGKLNQEKEVKTIKYNINSEKTVERGRVIFENCNRIIFESLRKEIKSVVTAGC